MDFRVFWSGFVGLRFSPVGFFGPIFLVSCFLLWILGFFGPVVLVYGMIFWGYSVLTPLHVRFVGVFNGFFILAIWLGFRLLCI